MSFTTSTFLFLFLPVAVAVYYSPICRREHLRKLWLIVCSLVFYTWAKPVYTLLLLASIVVNYAIGRLIAGCAQKEQGKKYVLLACLYDLAMLFVFRGYLAWLAGGMGYANLAEYLRTNITMPLGISFYTFSAISYLVDIYRNHGIQGSFLDAACYISFFGKVSEGPIVPYKEFVVWLENGAKRDRNDFHEGMWRFVIGLSKKMLLANRLVIVYEAAFEATDAERSVLMAWLGSLSYALYIYYDFSGYSDMAIGISRMLGFRFEENFNYPYISTSISEYWRRWHISMGAFFREYLYYPLSIGPAVRLRKRLAGKLSRKTTAFLANAFVLLVVWLATGIWHGANANFILWGLINFIFVLYDSRKPSAKRGKGAVVAGWIGTFFVLTVSRVFFVTDTPSAAIGYLASLCSLAGNTLSDTYGIYMLTQYRLYLLLGALFCFPVTRTLDQKIQDGNARQGWKTAWRIVKTAVLLICFAADIIFVIVGDYSPSVYANF